MGVLLQRPCVRSVVFGAMVLLGAGCSATDDATDDATDAGRDAAVTSSPASVGESVGGGDVTTPGQQPEGFSTMTARITEADGEICEICVWLADTSDERARGLMGVTDLGDAAGMVFRFEAPSAGSFYMFQTPTPLSIAWFAPDGGEFVGTADMAPCVDTPAGECALYSPGAEYELALEVFEGGLGDLGVGPGSQLVLVVGTEAESCSGANVNP